MERTDNFLEGFEKIAYGDNVSADADSQESMNFLFHISDIDTSIKKKKIFQQKLRKVFNIKGRKLSCSEFDIMVKKICNCCLKHIKDLHELHLKRCRALDMLNEIMDRMDVRCIKTSHVVHLVWSIMSCIHHFQLRFRSGTKSIIAWTRKRKAEECMKTYSRLISVLPKHTYRIVLNSLIIFYKEGRLWTIEFRLTDLISELLYLYNDIEEAIEDMLSTAENSSLSSEVEPKMLIKVLYEILGIIKWGRMTEDLLKRFLIMLRKSIVPKPEHTYNYGPMRSGLNICLRNITKNLNNQDLMALLVIIAKKITFREMEDDTLLEFGSIAEYAAHRYKTGRFVDSFPEVLMENIMIMMTSENSFHHLFAHRIMGNIMDRHSNKLEFEKPKIYFRGVKYNIKISKYSTRDRMYYKKHRHNIYRTLMIGLQHHYTNRINLENMYTMLAITCAEIPCSYVASSTVCFGMAMQEFILSSPTTSMVACHHVHAIVMSLMTLVCYVHNAEPRLTSYAPARNNMWLINQGYDLASLENSGIFRWIHTLCFISYVIQQVFYNYVNTLMERRSELSPHLNPPNKSSYNYAQHHVLWNQPDLFFEDWEARYGLWKCFRTAAQRKKQRDALTTSELL